MLGTPLTTESVFDSMGERDYCMWLDSEYQKGRILKVRVHVPIPLHAPGGKLIGHYEVDFEVTLADGHIEWHEYKGKWEAIAYWKTRHARFEYPHRKLLVIMDKDWHRRGRRRRVVR